MKTYDVCYNNGEGRDLMRLISWNVNGLRAILRKNFMEFFESADADILGIQEIKMQEGQGEPDLKGYESYYDYAERPGYSGTGVFTREKPLSFARGIGIEGHDDEGRVVTLEFDDFYYVNVYTPNSGRELARLEYRGTWDDAFREYVVRLDEKKPVVISGDLNVAHKEIDLRNPKTNTKSAGFTVEERDKFTALLEAGFVDTFRHLHPDTAEAYTWWSYVTRARERNAGWRIDYFLVSERLKDKITSAEILSDIYGSDHCPVLLELDI